MLYYQMRSQKGGARKIIFDYIFCIGFILAFLTECTAHLTTTTSPVASPPPLRGAARQMYGSGSLRPPGANPVYIHRSPKNPGSSPSPRQRQRPYFTPMAPISVSVPILQHYFDKLHGYPYPISDPLVVPGMISSPRSGTYTRTATRGGYAGAPEHSVRGIYRGLPEYYDPTFRRGQVYDPTQPDYSSKPSRGIVVHPNGYKGQHEEANQELPCGSDCPKGEFLCITSCVCIKEEDRCDGHMDCDNNEDELECGETEGTRKCEVSEKYIQCPKTGRCISKEWLCDGDDDCGDFTDETHCGSRINCTADQFECANGLCIQKTWVCDKDNDCKDYSDEVNCTRTGCTEDEFTCSNGSCISLNWKCDKQPDCDDESDEAECDIEPLPCNKGEFSCGNQQCVKSEFKCDGDNDCGDWSDEYDCPKTLGSCTSGEFKCNSGKCILDKWRCDKQQDCEDNEDEVNCDDSRTRTCSPDEFACNNGACIVHTWVCDGVSDCDHNEDESQCHHSCDESKFACSGSNLNDTTTQFCINKKHVCDGQKDCPKGEDEKNCPTRRECEKGSNCTQLCITTSDGKSGCSCNIGYNLAADGISCQDINECLYLTDPVCSQTCNNTIGSFRCGCMTGYILRPDLRSCKALGAPPTLLFANRVDIRQVSLSNQKYTALLKGLHNVIALDYHYEKKFIFWSDVSIDVIKRAYINGSGVTDIIKWGLESPGGVALDWVHDLLFWTDSGTRRIEVSSLDGKERAIIAAIDLDKPRAIAVHPGEALLFWTDWGPNPKIERADMDGSNRKSIITDSVFWPNGLTIDYTSNRVYWADAKHNVIESALFDGTDRKKVISKGLPHPFALTIFEDAIYWTDWHTKSISTANKVTGAGLRAIHSRLHFPMDIHSYHSQRQPAYRNRCGAKNGGCAHMCLPNSKNYTCVCRMGQKLKPDGTCLKPEKLLIFATKKDLRIKHLDKNAIHQHEMVIPVDGIKSAVALAWDSKTDTIFWTDVEKDTISRAHWNGSNQQVLVQSNIMSPAGLAYDWVTDKIYWTDAALGSPSIEVANSDGSMRGILIWEGLDKPRDIVLDPLGGYMFWSDWGDKPRIERTAMDGSMRLMITSQNVMWPNGLAVDHSAGKLYWADGGTKSIEYSNLDGSGRRVLLGPDLPHPFGLDVFGNYIYWTDWDASTIESANKLTGLNRTVLRPGTSGLMDVRVFHRTRKVGRNPCSNQNGGCSHLCLLKPKSHTCYCPIGITLESDGRTCANGPINFLIVAHRFNIRQISLDVPYMVDVVLPFRQLKNVVSVDVDRKTQELYWTDTAKDVIEKGTPDGKLVQTVISHELMMVDAIAIDSTGRKMYWTDGERDSIEVAELDGSNRKVLIWSDLHSPRAITLHYHHGLMFWSDWGTPAKIEVAQMDGSNRLALITENLEWPNGLAVDRPEGRLYWNDGKLQKIESSDLNGKDRKVILTDVKHPYGLVVVGNHMYWTDWQTQGLHRAEKLTGADETLIRGKLEGLMDVHSVQTDNIAENACGLANGGCSHLCLRNSKTYTCACPTGVKITEDNRTCEYQPENYLLFATRSALARISLQTDELWDVTLPITGISHAIDVDFHWKKQLLFYTDVKKHKIQSVNMRNISEVKDIISVNISTPNGVAVDWIADNIYWTDAETPAIEVSKLDGTYRKTLIKENLLEPRSIAVFPRKGYLYWTEWGKEPRIQRSFLDGSSRKTIIGSDLGFPNGLMIDYKGKRLYWTDARWDRIENSDLHGRNRIQLLIHSTPDILDTHPFGLTLFENFIYWTDWYQKSIHRANKATGSKAAIVKSNLEGAMGIAAVSESRQLGWNPCAVDNGGCSHLCFHQLVNYTCGCPDILDKPCSTEPTEWLSVKNPHPDYEDLNEDEDEKSYYDPNLAVFDDTLPEHPDVELPQRFYIMTLIPMLCIILLSIILLIVAILYKKSKKKYLYATGRSVRTFSNPNYYTTGNDGAAANPNNVDRRQFLWKRLKYDKSQKALQEEAEKACDDDIFEDGGYFDYSDVDPDYEKPDDMKELRMINMTKEGGMRVRMTKVEVKKQRRYHQQKKNPNFHGKALHEEAEKARDDDMFEDGGYFDYSDVDPDYEKPDDMKELRMINMTKEGGMRMTKVEVKKQRRHHQQKKNPNFQRDRVYEVKTGSSSPEVVSLIPNVLTPSSSNCEAVTPELERSPSVTPLHCTNSIQPVV